MAAACPSPSGSSSHCLSLRDLPLGLLSPLHGVASGRYKDPVQTPSASPSQDTWWSAHASCHLLACPLPSVP